MMANELWLCVYITDHADDSRIIASTNYLTFYYLYNSWICFSSKNQLSREWRVKTDISIYSKSY